MPRHLISRHLNVGLIMRFVSILCTEDKLISYNITYRNFDYISVVVTFLFITAFFTIGCNQLTPFSPFLSYVTGHPKRK